MIENAKRGDETTTAKHKQMLEWVRIIASCNTCVFWNIEDSPNCVCGESESNHQYLFECPHYNHIRLTLFDNFRQIPGSVCLKILLFGDDSQSLSDTKRVFEAVQSFIRASKCFN